MSDRPISITVTYSKEDGCFFSSPPADESLLDFFEGLSHIMASCVKLAQECGSTIGVDETVCRSVVVRHFTELLDVDYEGDGVIRIGGGA